MVILELEGESLLLKKPRATDTEPRDLEMNLILKYSSWGLVFIALEGSMQTSKEERSLEKMTISQNAELRSSI